MRDNAKASSDRSSFGRGAPLGLFGHAFATRGASSEGQGSGARSHGRPRAHLIFAASLLAALAVAALSAAPALAVRGHVFEKAFGTAGVGAGQVLRPEGVAVNESSGDVYVADHANNRIDEFTATGAFVRAWGYDVVASGADNIGANAVQKVTIKASGGKFSLTVRTAEGAGTLTSGSNTISGVSDGLGAFHVGDAITGAGIPSFTTITAVGATTLTISRTATQSGTAALIASENTGATGTGNLTELTSTVSGVVMRSGEFAVGERISGAGIPAGTTIAAVGSGTLTLSNPVQAGKSGANVALTASDIPYNATQSELEASLDGLPGIGSGSLAMSRVEKSSTEFEDTITFSGGAFAHNYVERMSLATGNLEGAKFGTGVAGLVSGGGIEVCQAGASPADSCKAGIAGSAAGQLSSPGGIAVDNSEEPSDLSAGDIYVTSGGSAIEKFTAAGSFVGQVTETPSRSFSFMNGLTVNRDGEVWTDYEPSSNERYVARFDDATPNVFVSEVNLELVAGSLNGRFEPGLAVDCENDLYIKGDITNVLTNQASKLVQKRSASGMDLIPEVGEEPAGWPAVECPSDEVYVGQATRVARYTSVGSLVERFGEGDLTSASGIAVNSASGIVYAVDSLADAVDLFPLEPSGKPTIENASVLDVASGGATFEVQVDPRGAATEYSFEYGPCSSLAAASCTTSAFPTAIPKPEASIASGWEVEGASVRPQSLEANTTYHFRVVAHNEHGKAVSDEVIFTTQALGGELRLLDGRQWEMVSPADKHGGRLLAPGGKEPEGLYEAAVDGSGVTYISVGATEAQAQGSSGYVQVLSSRGESGWSSRDIATPHDEGTAEDIFPEYRFFSGDLSLGILAPYGPFTPLERCTASGSCTSEVFPPVGERTVYERHNLTCESEPATCYTPLVTAAKGYEDIPPGTRFGGGETYSPGAVEPLGATPDGSHVVLSSTVALTEEAFETGSTPSFANNALYEWSADKPPTERLRLVSVLPETEGGKGISNTDLGTVKNAHNAISADGSRVFWSEHSSQQHLYMRDFARSKPETIQLGSGATLFQTANAEGSKAFFTESGALYVCEVVEQAGKLTCDLTDLTPGGGQAGKATFASEDGSYVYFVDTGVLSGEANAEHETAVAGVPNLYVRHFDGETKSWEATRLIAVLSPDEIGEWAGFGPATEISKTTIRVSPDGRYLAFMSDRPLTGYDNRDANPEAHGAHDEEVYLYDFQSGGVTCVSCNPTGARPAGERASSDQLLNNKLKDGMWFAAAVPGWNQIPVENGVYQPRYLTNEGRVFFDSTEALVPQDKNGAIDVYEYEPLGVPNGGEHPCATSSPTYSERSGGCVQLISSGTSGRESVFLDASENGGDAFFLTEAKLAGQDYDTAYDVYDAHECTAKAPCSPPSATASPPCTTTDSCRAAPVTQPSLFGSPSSALFSGAGNLASPSKLVVKGRTLTRAHKLANALKTCRKQKKRKGRAACERRARKRYGAKATRKASASRRGRR